MMKITSKQNPEENHKEAQEESSFFSDMNKNCEVDVAASSKNASVVVCSGKIEGRICCVSLAVKYGGELLYLWIIL